MAATPRNETRHGIAVAHPRYPVLPKVGQSIHPFLLALGAWRTVRRLQREGFDFDLIDAHFYYPDGVAAALLARCLGKPLVITARGSDLNSFGRDAVPRTWMRWAGGVADASIGVCQALVDVLHGWGLPPGRLNVVRNGVDTQRFRPQPQAAARAALGIAGAPLLLSVGNLVPVKGHDIALKALAQLMPTHPGVHWVFVGDGPLRGDLQAQAEALGIAKHVTFAGVIPNQALPAWYSAADALVLASRSEGWANVLLEAMACGTPVVATAVGGTAEVLAQPGIGRVVPPLAPQALAQGIASLLQSLPDRNAVRRYAEGFGWDETTAAQLRLFRQAVANHGAAQRGQTLTRA